MKFIITFCLLFFCLFSFAQNRISNHNTIGWYAVNIDPAITKKWSGHIEYQWRRNDIITQWQQSLLRIGFTYKPNAQVSLQAGYAWIETFPYSEYFIAPVRTTFPEHRLYEQVVFQSNAGKIKLTNRLRLEQRFNGKFTSLNDSKPQSFTYLNRIRFMPRIDMPLDKKNAWYAALYDEIFIGFGKNVGENVFDQNRTAVILGYNFNSAMKLEGGFLNQTLQLGRKINGSNVFQYNNGLIVTGYLAL